MKKLILLLLTLIVVPSFASAQEPTEPQLLAHIGKWFVTTQEVDDSTTIYAAWTIATTYHYKLEVPPALGVVCGFDRWQVFVDWFTYVSSDTIIPVQVEIDGREDELWQWFVPHIAGMRTSTIWGPIDLIYKLEQSEVVSIAALNERNPIFAAVFDLAMAKEAFNETERLCEADDKASGQSR
jgi:hypothetical protein